MFEVRETEQFSRWLGRLRDPTSRAIIARRIRQFAMAGAGDVKSVGDGVNELRIHYGPGFRVYFVYRAAAIVVLLCGGDKSTQVRDIAAAKAASKEIEG